MSLSLQQDVKLHEAENAWKPARVMDSNNMTDEEAKTDVRINSGVPSKTQFFLLYQLIHTCCYFFFLGFI